MSELSDRIKHLHSEGVSYAKIAEMLSCAKSTVSYHCGPEQKERSANRQRTRRGTNTVIAKVDRFKHANATVSDRVYTSSSEDQTRFKVLDFQREPDSGKRTVVFRFEDVLDKIGDDPICYLSGRNLNLDDPRSYELDHMIPRSRGGDNSLENLGATTREVNRAKGHLTNEEFIAMCLDVVRHNGYTVIE